MQKLRSIGFILVGAVAGVLISLNFQAIADRATRAPLPIEELRAFTEVVDAIKKNYVEPVEDKKLFTEAINGMLTGLDPHSAYLDQEAFKELQVGTQGQFGGLGIEVGMEDGFVKVISPIEDTPAFKAGIKPNDLIVKLDDTPVKGMTLNDAVKRMRGKPNTQITLTITRKGESAPIIVTLTRAIIKVQSITSKIVAGALQDHKRAVVLGTQTFGKGSVQTIMPLGNNTAIKLTTARYYTPNGRSIQALGITPDVVVEDPSDTATRVREADLQRHLENGRAEALKNAGKDKDSAPRARTVPALSPAELKPIDFGGKEDFQLAQAIAYLKGEPVKSQAPTVAQSTKTN